MRRYGVLVRGLLRTPDSILYRTLAGDEWTLTDHLLALVHDQLAMANWQRSKDGAKNRNRPKPLSPLMKRGVRYGKTSRDPRQVAAFLKSIGPRPSAVRGESDGGRGR